MRRGLAVRMLIGLLVGVIAGVIAHVTLGASPGLEAFVR